MAQDEGSQICARTCTLAPIFALRDLIRTEPLSNRYKFQILSPASDAALAVHTSKISA